MDLTVVDVPERERFEAREAGGAVAGVLTYQVTGPIIVLTHTDVGDRPDGREVEDALLRAAMEDARDKERTVVPMSPAVTAWLDSHREFEKIVARSTKKIRK
ncbi:GNAT family N-acetyltransferase [Actinoplanes sp. NPDC051470]|uniref:GNAT family N-acetyltransferase n=1 Tax=unclassified Actinoplanes TaxID=2626549 RepID=UPI00341AC6F2